MFCLVFFRKFWLPNSLHSSCNNSPTAGGPCQKCCTKYHDWVNAPQCFPPSFRRNLEGALFDLATYTYFVNPRRTERVCSPSPQVLPRLPGKAVNHAAAGGRPSWQPTSAASGRVMPRKAFSFSNISNLTSQMTKPHCNARNVMMGYAHEFEYWLHMFVRPSVRLSVRWWHGHWFLLRKRLNCTGFAFRFGHRK